MNKLIQLAHNLIDIPDGPNKHFSFIIRKSEILSIGWNSYSKTHPETVKWGYPWRYRHSEIHAIIKFSGRMEELKKCRLFNVRVNRLGEVGMSRPCKYCGPMLIEFGFREVLYTNSKGEFCAYI